MQKVYLLLRNNQQTGPFSLDELVQKNLKSFDLIWVEGKSAGWSYPSEVEALKPFVSATSSQKTVVNQPQPAGEKERVEKKSFSQKVFVSLPVANVSSVPSLQNNPPSSPVDSIEEKAEELRKRVQSYASQEYPAAEEIKTNYTRSINDVEEEYTSWMYQKKTNRKQLIGKRGIVITGLVVTGLAGGWWIANAFFSENAIPKPTAVVHNSQAVVQKDDSSTVNAEWTETETEPVAPSIKTSSPGKNTRIISPAIAGAKKLPLVQKLPASAPVPVQTEAVKEPQELPKENTVITEEKKEPVITDKQETPKEKRTLKTLFNTLFKKNKKDETVKEEPHSASNSNIERKATRRGEETTPSANTIDISDQVDIKTNKNAEDWMAGVQGLKLTLYNRSQLVLQSASVEVLYYSEQNDLLQKKLLQFSNILPKKSQTVAAPDHRMADHIEYKVISAAGVENAYASNEREP